MNVSLSLTRLTAETAPRFDLGAFRCGDPNYDEWLANCIAPVRAGSVTVFVLADDRPHEADGSGSTITPQPVAGYFALALTIVSATHLSKKLARNSDAVPAYLLARLALAEGLRGGTAGKNLLATALARMVIASETVPSRLLVIDAERPKVAELYASWGFTATRELDDDVDPTTGVYGTNLRLVAKTSSIRKALPPGFLAE